MGRKVRVTDLYSLELRQLGRRCGPVLGAGTTRGTARGKRRPALAFPSPSRAVLLLPPLPSPSFRAAAREGEDGGWAGSFAALWFSASEALAKQLRERARARAPPRRCETQQIQDSE